MATPRPDAWTESDKATLARLYPDRTNPQLALIFGRTAPAIQNQAMKQGLRKSNQHMLSRPGTFKKGDEAWNKGKKGLDLGGQAGHFKPGHCPTNWMPIGSERVTKGGILERKVTDTGCTRRDYRSVHSLVWEEHHGPIPAGHIVIFADGDRRHFAPSNLVLITRAENMRRNSIHRLPPELVDLCRTRGVLTRKLNQRRNA